MKIKIKGHELILSEHKVVYWPSEKTLILGDLHLGKSTYFNKKGIFVPKDIINYEIKRIKNLISIFAPKELIIIGDFFHAEINFEIEVFKKEFSKFKDIDFILVKGNHDFLDNKVYEDLGFNIHEEYFEKKELVFIHDYESLKHKLFQIFNDEVFYISAHVHPGFLLESSQKFNQRLPAFVHYKNYIIIPAFGEFTGLKLIKKDSNNKIYIVTEKKLFKI